MVSRVGPNRFCIGTKYSNGESDVEDDDHSRRNSTPAQEAAVDKGKITPSTGRTRPQFGPQVVRPASSSSSPASDGARPSGAALVDKEVSPNDALVHDVKSEKQPSSGTPKEPPTPRSSASSSGGRPRFGFHLPGERVTNTAQSNGFTDTVLPDKGVSPKRAQGMDRDNNQHIPGGTVKEATILKNDLHPNGAESGPPSASTYVPQNMQEKSSAFVGVPVDKIPEFRPRTDTSQKTGTGGGDQGNRSDPPPSAPPVDHGSSFFKRYISRVALDREKSSTEDTNGSVEEKRPPSQMSRSNSVQPGGQRQLENIWPTNVLYKRFADEIPFRREYTTGEVLTVYAQNIADPQCVFVVENDKEEYDQHMVELIVRIGEELSSKGSNMLVFRQMPPVRAAVCVHADVAEFNGKVWLRGEVISATPNGHVIVLGIDMGSVSVVPLSAIRSIPPELMKIPKWILPVQLSGRAFGGGDYRGQENIIEKTRQLVVGKGHEKPIQFLIEQKLGDCFVGSLCLGSRGGQLENLLDVYRSNGIKF